MNKPKTPLWAILYVIGLIIWLPFSVVFKLMKRQK